MTGVSTRVSTRPRVVCVGLSAFDLSWTVESLDAFGGSAGAKVRAVAFREEGGGMAANAAVAVARLGGDAVLWSRGGDDGPGRAMRDALQAAGVDVDGYRLFDAARSPASGIVVDRRGERLIVNFRGADLPDGTGWLPLERIDTAGAVLADPRWPDGAAAAFARARAAGVVTVLDGEVAEAHVFDRLLPAVDVAVFSEPGLRGYLGPAATDADGGVADAALDRILAAGCRVAGVTCGARGVVWRRDGVTRRVVPPPVDVVDTTGAGDVFHGALAWACAAGYDDADAFRFATAAAALKCTRPGGRDGAPDRAAVLTLIPCLKEFRC